MLNRRRALMAVGAKPLGANILDTGYGCRIDGSGSVSISTNGFACQGGCAVGDKIYFITVTQDNATQYLYSYNLISKATTLLGTYTELGHANDLTYNPDDDLFYVATQENQRLAVVDGSDYSFKEYLPIVIQEGTTKSPYTVTYDRQQKIIFSLYNYTLCAYDTSGVSLWRKTLDYQFHNTHQCLECDEEYIYTLWSQPTYVDVFTKSGTYVKSFPISHDDSNKEIESLCYDWNGNYYMTMFYSTGNQRMLAANFKTQDGWFDMAYAPFSAWGTKQTKGAITVGGLKKITFTSTASASYDIIAYGVGIPFSYAQLDGKKVRISYHLKPTGATPASGEQVGTALCTSTSKNTTNQRSFYYSFWRVLTLGERDVEINATWGEGNLAPTSGNEGTYSSIWIFLYAGNGKGAEVTNFKYEVEL